MKITTIYTPTDSTGQAFNLKNLYTLADLGSLGQKLAEAGVGPDDVLQFQVEPLTNNLVVVVEKTL